MRAIIQYGGKPPTSRTPRCMGSAAEPIRVAGSCADDHHPQGRFPNRSMPCQWDRDADKTGRGRKGTWGLDCADEVPSERAAADYVRSDVNRTRFMEALSNIVTNPGR